MRRAALTALCCGLGLAACASTEDPAKARAPRPLPAEVARTDATGPAWGPASTAPQAPAPSPSASR